MSRVISPSHPLKQLGTLLAAALILLSGMSSFHAPITAAASTKTLQALADGNLLFPSWWNGECDSINYRKKTGKDSYPLGGSYRGVKACGPRGGLTIVNFGTGTSQYEWQCVELVMRYMYLAFGQAPYNVPKGGKDVVAYYPGTALEKITNGTPGKAPRPGDVIAYGGYTNNPNHTHTSIVVAAAVDANGNGSIDTLNQNMSIWDARSAQGYRTERVRNWSLENGALGWLTPKGNVPPNTPQQLSPIHGAVMNTRTVTLQWQDTGDPDNGPQAHRDFYVEVQRGTEPPLLVLAWKPQQTWAITVPSDGTYVWRVRSGDTAPINGASAWSANRLFTVITGPCARKIEGDANCDGVINLQDFELFRQE
ncbi:MAG TPA: CHAP domain-containing protein, partial [Herpetosiphonaceae bacterium]